MPLLLMCGLPASGKTTRCAEFLAFLRGRDAQVSVTVVDEERFSADRERSHATPAAEKELRGFLRSCADQSLGAGAKELVVVDYCNSIKGFRYELYCLARSAKTTFAVVFCDVLLAEAERFNAAKEQRYSAEALRDLAGRFERPAAGNRGDAPLIAVAAEDALPCEELYSVLFVEKKRARDPVSTRQEAKLPANYVQDVDALLNEVVEQLSEALRPLEGCERPTQFAFCWRGQTARLRSSLTFFALKRLKNEFIASNRQNPIRDPLLCGSAFLSFIEQRGG